MRIGSVKRQTGETSVECTIDLDSSAGGLVNTGLPFFDHMIQQIIKHADIEIYIEAKGDLDVDEHHTIEDVGITMGQAFLKAMERKKGIARYGHAYTPMDEALTRSCIDISGRPSLHYNVEMSCHVVGGMSSEVFKEFFQGFVNHSFITLHIDTLKSANMHHQIESVFKSFAVALKQAIEIKCDAVPSTKGTL